MTRALAAWVAAVTLALASSAPAQERPDEAAMFGGDEAAAATDSADGGAAPAEPSAAAAEGERPTEDSLFGGERPSEGSMFGGDQPGEAAAVESPDAGIATGGGSERDRANLFGGRAESKFDTGEVPSDALKVGGNLLLTGQALFSEGRPVEETPFSAPMVLDAYLDGRPNDRVRAYAVGRIQFDPTRPTSDAQTQRVSVPSIGLTGATSTNPSVLLDQLWLRFDVERKVYFTVGRQKVRWGTSRIWYPTDFLNSRPRDALNPFDVRLGVNMVKVHVPVESLGWNFYGYGLLDNLASDANALSLDRLGGALRAELVLGPAELGLDGVWMKGRRPRYGVDLSTPVGPIDVYGEAAFRDGRDFLKFEIPGDLTTDNIFARQQEILDGAFRADRLVVQASGGLSWQFNYTDANMGILALEYFYNPMGYASPTEYLVQTFFPAALGQKPDPIQQVPLYGATHSLALVATAPGLPQVDWITLNASAIVNLSDPSGLVRLDAIFRVLTHLNVQAFAQVFWGQSSGELRFALPDEIINAIVSATPPAQQDTVRTQLRPLRYPPLFQGGVLLRLAI